MTILSQIRSRDSKGTIMIVGRPLRCLLRTCATLSLPSKKAFRGEEERTCVYDLRNADYSTLTRSMRARADNLKMTIAILEAKRNTA